MQPFVIDTFQNSRQNNQSTLVMHSHCRSNQLDQSCDRAMVGVVDIGRLPTRLFYVQNSRVKIGK